MPAKVFVDNETPGDAAGWGWGVMSLCLRSRPRRSSLCSMRLALRLRIRVVWDSDDDSDYAVMIATKSELGPRSLRTRIGPLRLAIAGIEVDGIATLVVALSPIATVDPGGHGTWKQQIEVLKEFVPTLTGPLIIAGDLNTTRYRPEFEELLALALSDAIDSLGKG